MEKRIKIYITTFFTITILFSLSIFCEAQDYRTINGSYNNLDKTNWGKKDALLLTITENGFGDSVSTLTENIRPNARYISNGLCKQNESILGELDLSDFVWAFGEFVNNDIVFTRKNKLEPIYVHIPEGDDYFEPKNKIKVYRTKAADGTGTEVSNPRKYANECTSFIDASNVYGSDSARAAWLRTFKDGKLKTSEGDLPPWNTISGEFNSQIDTNSPEQINEIKTGSKLFVCGDLRCNKNPLLLTFHTLFIREHNRICDNIKKENPNLSDEDIYQRARKKVGAYLQAIVYYEWLPIQGVILPKYKGYKKDINPGISNLFSAVGFKIEHTLANDTIFRLRKNGKKTKLGNIKTIETYFHPITFELTGEIEPFILGMEAKAQQNLDLKMFSDFRNYASENKNIKGLDFATLNIVRSRERGLPDYNTIRKNIGLARMTDFDKITSDEEIASKLKYFYGNVNNIDAWIGLMAEDHLPNSIYGETMTSILIDQFSRLRDGDRYYFENDKSFSEDEIKEIKNTKLRDIILRNTELDNIGYNVFTLNSDIIIEGPDVVHTNLNTVAYPNPVKNKLFVKLWSDNIGKLSVTIFNSLGKKLLHTEEELFRGENILKPIDFYNLRNGAYFILLESENEYRIVKIIKDE